MEDNIDKSKATARSAEFSASKPLPPIGSNNDQDDDAKSNASSAAFDHPGEGSARPRIVRGFRPEVLSDDEMEKEQQQLIGRTVSFSNGREVTSKRRTYDGREITFVTLNTQTDWDWVEEVEATGTARTIGETGSISGKEKGEISPRSASSKPDPSEDKPTPDVSQFQMPYSDEYGIPILDLSSDTDDKKRKAMTARKKKERPKAKQNVQKKLKSIKQKIAPKSARKEKKLPKLVEQYQRESEKHDIPVEDPEARAEGPDYDKDESGVTHGMFSGNCEFCHTPIKPFPTVEQQTKFAPEVLYCCNEYREFVEFVLSTSTEMEEEQTKKNKLIDIKPHEHVGSKQERNAAKEKAVQRMRERELQRRQQEASGLQQNFFASAPGGKQSLMKIPAGLGNLTMKDMYEANLEPSNIILDCLDTCPSRSKCRHSPAVAAEERGLTNRQEGGEIKGGEVVVRKRLISKGHTVACEAYQVCQIASEYLQALRINSHVARQMKTINYQLSSQKCLEEGWTLRAPSPLMEDAGDDVFTPEPLHPEMLADGKLRDRPLIEKFYENGKKFLTMFPDGTGNVFYPSGNLAILLSSVKLGQYNYTIHPDSQRSGVAAAFEPNGLGYCYFPNGDIRLYIDQYGGIELDNYGARRRKWSWKDQVTHVHAPPFQPICIGINRHMGIRVMSQDNISLTFSASKRSCRFNMGSRLKLVAPENAPLKEVEEEYIFLEEKKNHVDALLNKVANLLKFPNNPKLEKMLPPLHITSKQTKTEKMKKDRQLYLAQQSAREKKQPSITVTS